MNNNYCPLNQKANWKKNGNYSLKKLKNLWELNLRNTPLSKADRKG